MLSKQNLMKTPEFWIEEIQNEIFRQVNEYKENNNLNQNQLAEKLGFSKGYISQILSGNCNFSIKKLIELSLSLDKVPVVHFIKTDIYYELENLSSFIEKSKEQGYLFSNSKEVSHINITTKPYSIDLKKLNNSSIEVSPYLAA